MRQHIIITESFEELLSLKKSQKTYSSIQKVQLLEQLKQDPTIARDLSSKQLGISLRTQERWIKRYVNSGINGLLAPRTSSKQSKVITEEIHQALKERLFSSKDCFLGYWDAHQWVVSTFSSNVSYHNLRAYMKKHFKTKLKSPRKSHYKKDEQAVEAFLKNP